MIDRSDITIGIIRDVNVLEYSALVETPIGMYTALLPSITGQRGSSFYFTPDIGTFAIVGLFSDGNAVIINYIYSNPGTDFEIGNRPIPKPHTFTIKTFAGDRIITSEDKLKPGITIYSPKQIYMGISDKAKLELFTDKFNQLLYESDEIYNSIVNQLDLMEHTISSGSKTFYIKKTSSETSEQIADIQLKKNIQVYKSAGVYQISVDNGTNYAIINTDGNKIDLGLAPSGVTNPQIEIKLDLGTEPSIKLSVGGSAITLTSTGIKLSAPPGVDFTNKVATVQDVLTLIGTQNPTSVPSKQNIIISP